MNTAAKVLTFDTLTMYYSFMYRHDAFGDLLVLSNLSGRDM